jgi:hypothetical protein
MQRFGQSSVDDAGGLILVENPWPGWGREPAMSQAKRILFRIFHAEVFTQNFFPRMILFQASFPVRWRAGPSHAPCVGNTIVLFTTMAKVTRLNRSPPESIAS